jgi:glycosyltransferase involved in cell wall biosynthesis
VTFAYSVVIPAYNAAGTIEQAVESVLRQTTAPREIVVVDDGSTDGTAALVAAMAGGITLVRQGNEGPGAATTAGLRRVSTPFVATLDADDLWLPHKIARQAACFEADPDVAGVFALARLFGDGAEPDPDGAGAVREATSKRFTRRWSEGAARHGRGAGRRPDGRPRRPGRHATRCAEATVLPAASSCRAGPAPLVPLSGVEGVE